MYVPLPDLSRPLHDHSRLRSCGHPAHRPRSGVQPRLIDTALAHHAAATLAAADPDRWDRLQEPSTPDDSQAGVALRHAARHAKQHLAYQARTVLPLPDPHPPAVVDRSLLAELTAPLRDNLATSVPELFAAADTDRSQLAAVVLTGGGAHLPGLSDTLTEATGIVPVTPARPDLAAAYGTLHLTARHRPTRMPPMTTPDRGRGCGCADPT